MPHFALFYDTVDNFADRRQPYRITAEGLCVLRARLTTLQQFTKAGLKRLEAL